MVSSFLLALALTAWPLPRDAGAAAAAEPANWPNEPEWSEAWPLFSFTPSGWALDAVEQEAGVGMRVDRAWSVTLGDPQVVLGVIAAQLSLSDPLVAGAWRLNPGEFPGASDVNGNGRLDVNDFAADPRVTDINQNQALDLEDLLSALSDGVDQDGNGRVDDLCGWDLMRDAPIRSSPDAGVQPFRWLAAPVNDGRPGIGVCPDCTLLPVVGGPGELGAALRFAEDAGARAVLLPHLEAELDAQLSSALDEVGQSAVLITPGSAGLSTFPLALHPSVISPRTLTAPSDRTTARSRAGCGGAAPAASISVPTTNCTDEAAARLVGVAGLVSSAAPGLSPAQVIGLLGGPRVDAERAVRLAAQGAVPAFTPLARLRPSLPSLPPSAAQVCAVVRGDEEEPFACDAGPALRAPPTEVLESTPAAALIRVTERVEESSWSTALPAPPAEWLRGLLGVSQLGGGSGPPRYVDIDGLGSEAVLASAPEGLQGFTDRVELLTAGLPATRLAPAFGDVDGDRVLDAVVVGDDGVVEARSLSGRPVAGFPQQLAGLPAGPPVLAPTADGTALITLEQEGRLRHRVAQAEWTFELQQAQVSGPAAGFIDLGPFADLAIANGQELRVLITDRLGPTSASWRAPSRATQALLANLVGDAELEIVAEQVFDARGRVLLTLEGWTPPVTPPVLARIDRGSRRALLQVEPVDATTWELTRYDVEQALREGDTLARRQVLRRLAHRPARGGFVVADVTGDRLPDVVLPTEDGLLYVIDGLGQSPPESPWPTLGTVLSSPAVGVRDDALEFSLRTTRGDLIRWRASGLVEDLSWESAGHDRANTSNAETKLPLRRLGGLGVTTPPMFQPPGCGCGNEGALAALCLLFLFRRARRTC